MNPIDKPIVCYVTDRASLSVATGGNREEALLERIGSATAAGVDWIQLREKDLDTRSLLRLTRKTLAITRSADAHASPLLLLNDRLDVACAAGSDGVHLAETSLPVSAAARCKRVDRGGDSQRKFLVGASCHSQEGAIQAAGDGADYISFGPVFATPSKAAFGSPQGLIKLGEICRSVKIPVLAIGGITIWNAKACLEAGAAGIAAIGLFQRSENIASVLTDLRKRLS